MADYQHILIAIDFSEHTEQVIQRALAIATPGKSQLLLCHIVEDFPLTDFSYEPMISVEHEIREGLLEAGRKQVATLGEKYGVTAENQYVEFGHASRDIVRIAEEQHVDLIIVGSHGRRGIKILLGSTANAILHHAKSDVLAVRLQDSK